MFEPETVAGYRVVMKIAEGSHSKIYKCEAPDSGRIVAVKVLTAHTARVATKLTQRLHKAWEGQRALKLIHPNVVRTYEAGPWQETYYLVMEYLDGGNLSQHIERNSAEIQGRRISLLCQAARGLSYVHQSGIIHRDVCPRNFMLTGDGVLKLIDFSVAVGVGDVLRNTGARTGRAAYMAPEVIRENAFSERSDIYAFGITMYEMLTGQRPFKGNDRYVAMYNQLNVNPIPPSRYNNAIPPELEMLILRAMAKNPEERFRKMDELVVALTAMKDLTL